ncbi:MAG: DMT family transporter [Rhodospirillaceae bacterium]|nr:MAG: DMT family transporter [Rhodospirillaceae bacterium]
MTFSSGLRLAGSARNAYMRGLVLVTLAMLFSSTSGLFVRSLPDLDPWTINAYRGGFMSLSLLIYLLAIYRRAMPALFMPSQPVAFLLSATAFGAATTCYVVAISLASSVASVAALSATAPIFAALLAWLVLRERTSAVVLGAAVLAFIGILAIARSEDGNSGAGNGLLVTVLGLGVPLFMALQTVVLKRFAQIDMTPALVIGGLAVAVLVWLLHGIPLLTPKQFLILALMGLLQLAVSLVCFLRGAPHVPAVQTMLIAMGDVLCNPLWPWLVYGERVPFKVFVGGGLIFIAILVATLWPQLRRRHEQMNRIGHQKRQKA